MLEIQGKITKIVQANQDDKYPTSGVEIETFGDYPKNVYFEFMGKNVEKPSSRNEGDVVTVLFDVKSREYNGKYYTTAVGIGFKQDKGGSREEQFKSEPRAVKGGPAIPKATTGKDELPF